MARLDRGAFAVAAIVLASACTVFNGKTFDEDAGGSSVDAGATDRDASVDGSNDDASAACGCPVDDGVLCEGFEGSAFGAAWTASDTPPTPDTTQKHCGRGSLHVHVPAFGAGSELASTIEERQTFSDARFAGGFHARAWVYVPSSSQLPAGNYFTIVETRQNGAPFDGIGFQVHPGFTSITNWTATPVGNVQTNAIFPRDAWTCVEWSVTYGASNGQSQAWLGDVSTPTLSLDATNTAPTPGYGSLVVGAFVASETNPQPALDLWIDDVVVSPRRIGCGP